MALPRLLLLAGAARAQLELGVTHHVAHGEWSSLGAVGLAGLAARAGAWAEQQLGEATWAEQQPGEGDAAAADYWNFLPSLDCALVPGNATSCASARRDAPSTCFARVSGRAAPLDATNATRLSLEFAGARRAGCADTVVLLTLTGWRVERVRASPRTGGAALDVGWAPPAGASDAEVWDLARRGVRAFRLLVPPATALASLAATARLFAPLATKAVPRAAAERNVDFLKRYAGFDYAPLGAPAAALDASAVRSGDFIGVMRLDGLDPLLAWAMGSTTGHTTTALWFDDDGDGRDDALYVLESQAQSAYWPYVDGVQRTPWATWVARARAAGYNAVLLPLSARARAAYNATAARAFFFEAQGLEYGYETLLYGWFDTPSANLPCLPRRGGAGLPEASCLEWALVETLFGLVDRAAPAAADAIWIGAWNRRVGATGLRTPALLRAADAQGAPSAALMTIPEADAWRYETYLVDQSTCDEQAETCDKTLVAGGRAMVCCVFVCNVYKAAGLFDAIEGGRDAMNCGEQTNADVYALDIFEPDATKTVQFSGEFELALWPPPGSRPRYAHMNERCPSLAEDGYAHPDGC